MASKRRSPAALFFLLLIFCMFLGNPGAAPAKDGPVPVDVLDALQMLEGDDLKKCGRALEILAKSGHRKVIQKVAEFGATTAHRQLTLTAGNIVVAGGVDSAKKELARLLSRFSRRSDYLERVALMAECLPGTEGVKTLENLARHSVEKVASQAVRGLGARKSEESRRGLEGLAQGNRPAVAQSAAYALAGLPPAKSTIDILLGRATRGDRDRIGDSCAIALTLMEGAEKYGVQALDVMPKRESSDAFHALTKLVLRAAVDPPVDKVLALMRSKNGRTREVGCDLAGVQKVNDPEVQKLLIRIGRTEKNWRVRVAAFLALCRTGYEHVKDEISATIVQPGEVSYWAIQCVMRNPDDSLVPALISVALDTKDPVRRELAQRALRFHGRTDEVREYFVKNAKEHAGTDRGAAAFLGLGNLKDAQTFLVLVDLLKQADSPTVKYQVVKGLEKLTGHLYEPDPEIWMQWYEVMDGQVSYIPKPIDRKKNRERIGKIKGVGISPTTEKAVEAGLLWLSRHQDATGAWNGSTFSDHCPRGECRDQGGIRDRPLAYTALALLAFQGAGYTHLDGPYRDIMRRGFEYIMAQQDYDGSHHEKSWTFSYEAALICQALCDAYALTGDKWIGEGAQRTIDYIVKIQHPGETWRYQVRSRETDTSVMSWILMACVSARHAGLHVPEQVYVCCEWWLDRASDPVPEGEYEVFNAAHFDPEGTYGIDISKDKYGRSRNYRLKTWYLPPQLFTPAMPAIGVLCRIWMGWTRAHPACIGNANTLMDNIPGYGTGLQKEYAFFPYTWYYGSLAMYQMGGRYWRKWREKCITELIVHQQTKGHLAGSWKMPREQFVAGLTGGPVYCTAMAILTLETFYRYQPYLARAPLRAPEEEDKPDGDDDDDGDDDPDAGDPKPDDPPKDGE